MDLKQILAYIGTALVSILIGYLVWGTGKTTLTTGRETLSTTIYLPADTSRETLHYTVEHTPAWWDSMLALYEPDTVKVSDPEAQRRIEEYISILKLQRERITELSRGHGVLDKLCIGCTGDSTPSVQADININSDRANQSITYTITDPRFKVPQLSIHDTIHTTPPFFSHLSINGSAVFPFRGSAPNYGLSLSYDIIQDDFTFVPEAGNSTLYQWYGAFAARWYLFR